MLPRHVGQRNPHARWRLTLVGAALVGTLGFVTPGCGDVYVSLDVVTQKTMDPDLFPSAVQRNSVHDIQLTIEGVEALGSPQIIETGIDNGKLGIEWYGQRKFEPGPCPDEDGISHGEPTNSFGDLIFCGTISVLDPTEDALSIRIVLHNGVEDFEGVGKLEVVGTAEATP